MPLINLFLENDAPGVVITNPEERRQNWNTEKIIRQETSDNLPAQIYGFVDKFIKTGFIDPQTQEPKPELVLMFTINKKIVNELINQPDCEGIRVFLSSKESRYGLSTNVVLKPVNATLHELDVINPATNVLVCDRLTECPPPVERCPHTRFNDFLDKLKVQLNNE